MANLPCCILDTTSIFSAPVTRIRHLQQILILVKDFLWGLYAIEYLVIMMDFLLMQSKNKFIGL